MKAGTRGSRTCGAGPTLKVALWQEFCSGPAHSAIFPIAAPLTWAKRTPGPLRFTPKHTLLLSGF